MNTVFKIIIIFMLTVGQVWGGVDLNSDADYILPDNIGDLGTTYTVGAVFKTDSVVGNRVVMAYRTSTLASPANDLAFQLDQNGDDVRLIVRDNAGNIATATKADVLTTTAYFAVVGVRDGDNLSVYVNQLTVATATASIGAMTMNRLVLGGIYNDAINAYGSFWNGKISECFVSERPWTASEAQGWTSARLKRHSYVIDADAYSYWQLDEGSNGSILSTAASFYKDIVGGFHGTGVDADGDSLNSAEEFMSYPSNF